MLQNEYEWTDIKISEFDFMSLEINIEEHIREPLNLNLMQTIIIIIGKKCD